MATENRKVSTRRLSNARRKRIQNRRMMIAISAVVVAFCIVIGGQMISKYSTLADLSGSDMSSGGAQQINFAAGIYEVQRCNSI